MDEVLNSSIKLNANKLNYVSLKRQRERLVPLAFTMPDDAPPVPVDGFTISWTSEALASFSKMKTDIRSSNSSFVKNMPYAWLRGLMEVSLQNILRVEPNIGLSPYALTTEAQNQPQPFAYLDGGSKHQTRAALQPLLNDWIVNHLIPYAEREGVLPTTIDQLRELQENNKLLSITPFQSQVLPWLWSEQTGTTKPRDIKLYHVLVDYVARLLAGREIFKELGPLKRIITSRSGITSGLVELITDPILLTNKKGLFSLVIRLEVVTFPSRHQPLLTLNVSKRRWLNSLTENSFDRRVISGLVFSRNHPDRAFSYVLKCKGNQDQTRQWKPDSAFEVLRRELQLPTQVFDGRQIVQGEANNEDCQVMLTYREGIQDREEHGIETGVPEIDKLEAFDAIAKILAPVGLKPFDDYSPVKFGKGQSHITDNTASRVINTPTLLSATLQTLETGSGSDFTPQYLASKNDDEVNHLLRQHFQVGLDGIQQTWKSIRFGGEDKDQTSELEALIAANQEAIRRIYPNDRPLFVIFYQEGTRDDLKILEAVIRVLWGNALDIQKNKLPPKTHGPRAELPDKELNAAGRSEKRREAWSGTVRQIAALNRRTFCLILANEFYSDSNDGSSWKHDDPVNKLSTRQALASIAGSCVQFILPSKRTKTGKINFADFLQRIQSATKDLISAHSGRIDGIREKVNHWLSDIPPEARPKEIMGITIVRKNSGRARQSIGTTFLPIAIRINVEAGQCEMCCAYEQAGNDKISLWQRFPDAISTVSRISPVRLAEKKNVAKTRFMRFVEQIISASVEEEKNPLVVIDSSNCAQLWSWLTDQRIDLANVDIGEHQWMQETWRNARIVRIRQDLAPDIIEDKVQLLAKASPEDEKSSDELLYETVRGCITWSILFQELEFQRYFLLSKKISEDNSELENRRLQTPSAQITGLFRLKATNQAGCLTYLSLQHDGTNHEKRGLSCYRETEIAREKKIKEGKALLIFWLKRYREIQKNQRVEPEELDLWFISLAYGLICGRPEGNEWKTVYNKAKLRLHTLEKLPPYVDRWATPSPLEIVVALRREGDSSDRLAALVESLRTGFGHSSKWTKLPAPLFFERVVRNYISAFAFEHEDSEAISEVDNSD